MLIYLQGGGRGGGQAEKSEGETAGFRIRSFLTSWIRICIRVKSRIRIRILLLTLSQCLGALGSKWSRGGLWTLTIVTWRLKTEPCEVCDPVDSHPDLHLS
jgi:hypothetical protein